MQTQHSVIAWLVNKMHNGMWVRRRRFGRIHSVSQFSHPQQNTIIEYKVRVRWSKLANGYWRWCTLKHSINIISTELELLFYVAGWPTSIWSRSIDGSPWKWTPAPITDDDWKSNDLFLLLFLVIIISQQRNMWRRHGQRSNLAVMWRTWNSNHN